MDLIQLSEQLKGVQDGYLEQQIQNPGGAVPPFLALSELNRRKQLRSQVVEPPKATVAQDVLMQPPPMMPQGMGSTDMLNQQQPQPQMPQQPQGGMPMGGGLAAMTPPMPQGPPAPQRMARGGLVGTGEDRILGKGNTYWGDGVVRMQLGGIVSRTPAGWNYRIKGRDYAVSGRPEFRFPEWQEPERITVARPKLEEFLGEVRSITGDPEGYVSPLEKRIGELEEQRRNVRRPNFSQGLIEAGLGMMASKALTPGQAFGEAAGAAYQNYQARQMMADQREQQITERLAGLDASREEQQRRARSEELRAASELASRKYGADMVEAQLRGQQQGDQRRWELERYKAEQDFGSRNWATEVGLQMQAIKDATTPEQASDFQRHQWDLEKLDRQHANAVKLAGMRGSGYGGGLGSFRNLPDSALLAAAENLMRTEGGKWQVGGEDTRQTYMDRLRQVLSQEVWEGKRLRDLPMSGADRWQLSNILGGYDFDPKKQADAIAAIDKHVTEGKAAALATGAKAAAAGAFAPGIHRVGGDASVDIDITPGARPRSSSSGGLGGGHLTPGYGSRGGHDPNFRPVVVPGISESTLQPGSGSRGSSGTSGRLGGSYGPQNRPLTDRKVMPREGASLWWPGMEDYGMEEEDWRRYWRDRAGLAG